jgi:hypothetical protein
MKIALVNDGPVTIFMDSKMREWFSLFHKFILSLLPTQKATALFKTC